LTALYAVSSHQIADRQAQVVQVKRQADIAQGRAAVLAPYAQFASLRDQRVSVISTIARQRIDWPQRMRDIASVLPPKALLISLDAGSGSSPGAAPPPAAAPGSASTPAGPNIIQLTGCGDRQNQVGDV